MTKELLKTSDVRAWKSDKPDHVYEVKKNSARIRHEIYDKLADQGGYRHRLIVEQWNGSEYIDPVEGDFVGFDESASCKKYVGVIDPDWKENGRNFIAEIIFENDWKSN